MRALRARGDEVLPVVRGQLAPGEIGLDLRAGRLDTSKVPGRSLEALDAAVHLAGAPIATRWTPKRIEEIRTSRVTLGSLLAHSLASLDKPPSVLVSGSAIGIYGSRGEEVLDETSAQGSGELADLCRSWEASTAPAAERGIRVVTIRTGVVLGGAGGVLAAELPAFRLGLGARLGDGRQWTSWISLEDEVGVILRAIDDAGLAGAGERDLPEPGPQRRADRRHRRGRRPPCAARGARSRAPPRARSRSRRRAGPRKPAGAAAQSCSSSATSTSIALSKTPWRHTLAPRAQSRFAP